MDISTSVISNTYIKSRAATEGPVTGPAHGALTSFEETMKATEQTAQASLMGQADPHALVEALSQTQLAVETAVAVRDKVVEAYQEILRMPV